MRIVFPVKYIFNLANSVLKKPKWIVTADHAKREFFVIVQAFMLNRRPFIANFLQKLCNELLHHLVFDNRTKALLNLVVWIVRASPNELEASFSAVIRCLV